MDEALKKYLESKYDPAVLASEDADRDIQGNTNAALMRSAAQIGTFGGKTSDASPFADAVKTNQAARARSTAGYNDAFEMQGAQAMKGAQAAKLGAETAAIQGENDPNSQTSISFRETLKKVMPGVTQIPGYETMSYAQLNKSVPLFKEQFKPKEPKEAPRGTKVGTTPDGKIVYSDGTREWIGTTGVAVDTPSAPKITAEQTSTALFSRAAEGAAQAIDAIEAAGYNPSSYGRSIRGISNATSSKDDQLYITKQKEFIAAILRKESGGAITPDEFREWGQIYFPQPGDHPDVIAEKKRSRNAKVAELKAAAGNEAMAKTPARTPYIHKVPKKTGQALADDGDDGLLTPEQEQRLMDLEMKFGGENAANPR